MLITNFRYATGSFFHQEGKECASKIVDNPALIIVGFVVDSVAAASLILIGCIALLSFAPHALRSLHLSVKVVMISGGVSIIALNGGYMYYRFKGVEAEMRRDVRVMATDLTHETEEHHKALSEGAKVYSEALEELERINTNLQDKLKALELLNLDDLGLDMAQKVIKFKEKVKGLITKNIELSENLKSKIQGCISSMEEVKAISKTLSAEFASFQTK